MTTGVDAALLEDLNGDLLKVGWARRARTWIGCALSIATPSQKRHERERN
jgi:hypothetical protein